MAAGQKENETHSEIMRTLQGLQIEWQERAYNVSITTEIKPPKRRRNGKTDQYQCKYIASSKQKSNCPNVTHTLYLLCNLFTPNEQSENEICCHWCLIYITALQTARCQDTSHGNVAQCGSRGTGELCQAYSPSFG